MIVGYDSKLFEFITTDKFSKLFGDQIGESKAKAVTTIGYIDGAKIYIFTGEISGSILDSPRGNRDFQWDCVFVPDGETQTFAEMGNRKNEISMRKIALEKFTAFIKSR